jgi:hypothetical protein
MKNYGFIIFLMIIFLVLVFWFMYINKKTNEKFVNTPNLIDTNDLTVKRINEFAQKIQSSQLQGNLTSDQTQLNNALLKEINDLNMSMKLLIEKQSSVASVSSTQNRPIPVSNENPIDDIRVLQIEQDNYIEKLKNRLENLQKIYASYLQKKMQQKQTIKYDKIPVYSSCIVAEADGKYTIDKK